jgi:hypothetical protein
MQLETEIGAWALDEACLMIGRKFENMLNEGKDPFSRQSTGFCERAEAKYQEGERCQFNWVVHTEKLSLTPVA